MKKIENSEQFYEIINDLNNQNLNQALKKTKLISKNYPNENIVSKLFATIYFKLMDWKNAIKYYEKNLIFENEKYKIYTNIGVALFKLGKINKSILAFKNSIKDNQNFDLAHNNLGISYMELGKYKKAIKHFIFALKLNNSDINAQSNLISILNLFKPKNIDEHPLININSKINNLDEKNKATFNINEKSIKIILEESNNLIDNFKKNLFLNETQIFRKNSENLNCNRHFKIFNEFNIIPKYCFSCFKVQINLKTVVDLVKLFLIFDKIKLKNNNIRKCIVEIRDKIKGNYKGYIYCNSTDEAKEIKGKISEMIITNKINLLSILIKHGCTEFYKSYPKFEKINFNGDQEMKYDENWIEKENIIDSRDPFRMELDKKVWTKSINGINLSDILIINNWINYANTIGDYSYKRIFGKEIKHTLINKILSNQKEFRRKEFNI